MKWVGLGLIFIGCMMGGIWVDQDQRKRLKELGELTYVFELLKAEIDYQLTPLKEACQKGGCRSQEGVGKIFIEFAQQLEGKSSTDVNKMWQQAIERHKDALHLLQQDYELLEDFGGACGYLDKQMQERNLEMTIEKIEYVRKGAQEKYERCSKLNKSLGILIGAAIVIFLI